MTLFTLPRKSVFKGMTMALLAFFVVSSLAGATESVLCLDRGEMHIMGEDCHLDPCHASGAGHSENKAFQIAFAGTGLHHENSCVDVALRLQELSILRHKLEKAAPILLSSVLVSSAYLPSFASSSCLNTAGPSFYKYSRILPLALLRPVVLLI